MRHIAVLNSGGDSPGMNAAVSAIARAAVMHKMPLVGIIRGYRGIIRNDPALLDAFFDNARRVTAKDKDAQQRVEQLEKALRSEADNVVLPDIRPLLKKYRQDLSVVESIDEFLIKYSDFKGDMIHLDTEITLDINNMPGSYLRTARCEAFKQPIVRMRALVNMVAAGIEGLVVIGGDGSYQGATLLCEIGMPCICIPGTIDNDLAYTEMTLGYDTAMNVCMHAIMQVRSTSRAHDRPHVVEVMGRDCGDLALKSAMASGSEIVIVREVPWCIEDVVARLQSQIDRGNLRPTVVIAEGAYKSMEKFDLYGFLSPIYDELNKKREPDRQLKIWYDEPMDAYRLAEVLKYKCHDADGLPVEARATVLGYTQRGEEPSAYDASFAFEAGNEAIRLLLQNKENLAIGIKEGRVYSLPIERVFKMQTSRDGRFDLKMYHLVNSL